MEKQIISVRDKDGWEIINENARAPLFAARFVSPSGREYIVRGHGHTHRWGTHGAYGRIYVLHSGREIELFEEETYYRVPDPFTATFLRWALERVKALENALEASNE